MPVRFLLIDDDEDEFVIFSDALSQVDPDSSVIWAQDADSAMRLLTNETPDIIFLDLNMPRVSGLECLKSIRQLPEFAKLPVIAYSHGMNYPMYVKCMELGADGCVSKVNSIQQLKSVLNWIFQENDYNKMFHQFVR